MPLAAMPSTSSGAWRNPVTPCSTTSGSPPTRDAIDRNAARHRLERREAEALLGGRQEEQVRDGQERRDRILLAERVHAIRDAELPRQIECVAQVRPVADEQEPRRHQGGDAREDIDHRPHALHRPEIGDVHDELLAAWRAMALPQLGLRGPQVDGAVEEIGDDRDFAVDLQDPVRVGAEALRHRRHAVRVLDRERDRLRIGPIAADERDIGAVERRHDLRHLARRLEQDLFREIRRGGVRHRIVRVHDVELILARDLDDACRDREEILRLAEERVGRAC